MHGCNYLYPNTGLVFWWTVWDEGGNRRVQLLMLKCQMNVGPAMLGAGPHPYPLQQLVPRSWGFLGPCSSLTSQSADARILLSPCCQLNLLSVFQKSTDISWSLLFFFFFYLRGLVPLFLFLKPLSSQWDSRRELSVTLNHRFFSTASELFSSWSFPPPPPLEGVHLIFLPLYSLTHHLPVLTSSDC